MKLSEKQFIVLMDTLRGSLELVDNRTALSMFSYRREVRTKVYNDILTSASDEPIEISRMSPSEEGK